MKTAFETAIEISYYAGKLWDRATDPDISQGKILSNDSKMVVPKYGQPEDGQAMLSANVPELLKAKFEELAKIGLQNSDDLTANSLKSSLSTLQRVAALPDPADGYTTHFSNIQRPLKEALPQIKVIADKMMLTHS